MKNFKLDDYPKIADGFKVPEGYFEQLPTSVFERINQAEVSVIPLYKRTKFLWTAAAALIVAALMIPFLNHTPQSVPPDHVAIENYLAYQSNFSEYEIASLLDDKDLENMDADIRLEDKTIEEVLLSDNDIENLIN
ncbi:MAG: hypothetical protein CFE23_05275 [Flavobacterium sp. BFFFF1]|uniref:hypothetical protein n=1 Tax=Flavobacterium sp. BFFFF1 TaxID=2015557 RepID=UPI000BD0F385|nr:hypothetical protein [Flavobacterium sp. BFFFF1]OYU81181.1 MAG: hypothetical protein CFE23_05275 [Flavobacterium sp. BFFFF1]